MARSELIYFPRVVLQLHSLEVGLEKVYACKSYSVGGRPVAAFITYVPETHRFYCQAFLCSSEVGWIWGNAVIGCSSICLSVSVSLAH